jgi:Ca2+-transporting ATPase
MWHSMTADAVADSLNVSLDDGLTSAEARVRLKRNGPNRLTAKAKESAWRAFMRQYRDLMQMVLVSAALITFFVSHDAVTAAVIFALTVFNAIIGLRQEAKAEESLEALQKMLKPVTRVRRDGQPMEIDSGDVVAGDIVLLEAGSRVPADGRLAVAASLEIEEAALTGESVPAGKSLEAVEGNNVPLGDRTCMAFMNTSVTRGRAEMIVTGTGMNTEIGHVASLLQDTEAEKTPLQKKLDELLKVIGILAAVSVVLVVVLGLRRGESFQMLFITGVAVAVASIPTELPAVISTLLAMGTRDLANRGAIVKRLAATETLGSTSAICSDKTGTLTMNKMMARELVIPGQNRFTVTGEGYLPVGQISHVGGLNTDLDPYLLPMILCADASLDGEALIGDPTEGALIVLAAKGGLDIEATREAYPRIAEVPFDSDYKFMATFHQMQDSDRSVIRCYVKGAPDVLIGLGAAYRHPDGTVTPIDHQNRGLALSANERMARAGERVIVVAQRDLNPAEFDPGVDLRAFVRDLTLLAMVGIVDPPRPEAKKAIARCKRAGIHVRMITGDHAVTAAAIGNELGITGRALTGAEFAAMSDEQLAKALPDIGVVARVSPEDKIRLVRMLQRQRNVVAMTGDGVNDAPALKAADIGVAMGITGTEVSKEAAVMILTDDNFATIVSAVEFGRGLYDNLMKYLRFQMATLVGYISAFLMSGVFFIAGGVPLNPFQILWLNMVIDIPIVIALGFDDPIPGLMQRRPRPLDAPVLSAGDWIRLTVQGLLMMAGALFIYEYVEPATGPLVAGTMLLTTLSLFHIFGALHSRDPLRTLFSRASIPGARQLRLYGIAVMLMILVTEVGFMQRWFGTSELKAAQWAGCTTVAASLIVIEEVWKAVLRRRVQMRDAVIEA